MIVLSGIFFCSAVLVVFKDHLSGMSLGENYHTLPKGLMGLSIFICSVFFAHISLLPIFNWITIKCDIFSFSMKLKTRTESSISFQYLEKDTLPKIARTIALLGFFPGLVALLLGYLFGRLDHVEDILFTSVAVPIGYMTCLGIPLRLGRIPGNIILKWIGGVVITGVFEFESLQRKNRRRPRKARA